MDDRSILSGTFSRRRPGNPINAGMRRSGTIIALVCGLLLPTGSVALARGHSHHRGHTVCTRHKGRHHHKSCRRSKRHARRHRGRQVPTAVKASGGSLVFDGTFDSSLSNYAVANGSCFSLVNSEQVRFDITSSCDPGQDGLYRSDLSTRNIYPAGVAECTTIPVDFPANTPGVPDSTWLMFAETEDPYNPNQNDHAGWGMYLTSYFNGDRPGDPNQFEIAFADYNDAAPAWTSSSNVDSGWHTLSICTNDANDNTGIVYGIWLDGVRQTFNHGPQAGSQTLSGFPIIQNDPGNSSSWPLIVNDYTGGAPSNQLVHGAPLVSRMDSNQTPPAPAGGWTSP